MKIFILLCFLFVHLSLVSCISLGEIARHQWEIFKANHKKSYESDHEERFRFKVFLENTARIARHNSLVATNGYRNYTMQMNIYGDLLHHEFLKLNGYNASLKTSNRSTFLTPMNFELPKSVDWRKHGLVTPVKDQKQCGSCWAFSATGALEGQIFRKTGKLVSLSEQNLVDCSKKEGNNGCEGGMMDQAFDYVLHNKGVDTESSYPYEGVDGKCRFKKSHIGGTDTGSVDIESGNVKKLMEAVASVGPVSVAIDAGHPSFQFYHKGVYDEEECSSTDLDHGVLVVGYDTTEEGIDHWLIKNSWGETWGDEGYVRIARKDNLCGVATQASYPTV